MGKYDALGTFLRRWAVRNKAHQVELSFTQIEGTIRTILPKAASRGEWWSNESGDRYSAQCRAWLDSGFEARLLPGDRVMFSRSGRLP